MVLTIALYILAVTGISAVGYISSGAALLLTLLRLAISDYEYLYFRLRIIREAVTDPRENILELRNRFYKLEQKVQFLDDQLNPDQLCYFSANH